MRLGLPRKRINAATPPIVKMIATITPPMAAIIGILVDGLDAAAFAATTIVEGDGLIVIVRDAVVVAVAVAVIVYDEDGVAPLLSLDVGLSVREAVSVCVALEVGEPPARDRVAVIVWVELCVGLRTVLLALGVTTALEGVAVAVIVGSKFVELAVGVTRERE